MAAIPSFVFIILGIMFSFVSLYINSLHDTTSLTLFVYVGYLFMAYGIARMLISYILKSDKSEKRSHKGELPDTESFTEAASANKKHPDRYGYIGYCPRCNTPMRRINVFCHRCGQRQSQR